MPPKPAKGGLDTLSKSQSQSRSHSKSRSQPQPQTQSQGQPPYRVAMSTSFGEIQDPIRWMSRTPLSTPTTAGHPPFVFSSRQTQRPSSPYPAAGVTAARGYLPPHQLLGGRPQGNRSPPVPLYRRFPTPRFTSSTAPIPSLRSDTNRPYSATTYRVQRANTVDDRDIVVLPPRPATSSDVDWLVPPRRTAFSGRTAAQDANRTLRETSSETGNRIHASETTPRSASQPTQQYGSKRLPKIIIKNYRQVPKPLDLMETSTVAQDFQQKPTDSPASSIKTDSLQAPETKQEHGREQEQDDDDDDETVTGSSDSSGDELGLDIAQHVLTPKKPVVRLPAKAAKQRSTTKSDNIEKHFTPRDSLQKTSETFNDDSQLQKPVAEHTYLQKRPYTNASTQANENWLVSSATQTVFEEEPVTPKRQKVSDTETIASVIKQAHTMLMDKVTPLSKLDEIVAINQDVGQMAADRLQTGDAGVLEELDALMLVKIVVDDEDMYGRVERMLGVA